MVISIILLTSTGYGVLSVLKWILVGVGVILSIRSIIQLAHGVNIISSIILYVLGIIPIFFWACIPYLDIAKWIFPVFSLVTALELSTEKHYSEKWVLLYLPCLVIHPLASACLGTNEGPSDFWDFYVVGIILLFSYVIYYMGEIGKLDNFWNLLAKDYVEKNEKLIQKLKDYFRPEGVPIPDNAIFDYKSKTYAKRYLKKYTKLQKLLSKEPSGTPKSWEIKQKIYNTKLDILYLISLRGESQDNLDIYHYEFEFDYNWAIKIIEKDYLFLREDDDEEEILSNVDIPIMEDIGNLELNLRNDKTKSYRNEIKQIEKMSTTSSLLGVSYTSVGKLGGQTRAYADLVKAVNDEYMEMENASIEINDILATIRLCAYRNIYLGAELLNYITDRGGGGKLTTEKDGICVDGVNIGSVNVKTFDSFEISLRATLSGFNTTYSSLLRSGMGKKGAIALAGVAGIVNAAVARLDAIIENQEQQARLIDALNQLIPQIQKGQAEQLRVLEIIKGIIETNNGFIRIYAPLRDKVFSTGEPITKKDLIDLTEAVSAYNNISKSRIYESV